ncbi:MAG: M20/M25/M40 family metallo-hydrolase [Firmicutes bacterium]|nr:M20/M25/M40 family metallo-hydrolase [Bacillota bacterium]
MNHLKDLVLSCFDRDELLTLALKVLGTPSPQTELFEREPQVLDFIWKVVEPYLLGLGLDTTTDPMGNIFARIGAPPTAATAAAAPAARASSGSPGGSPHGGSLMLVGYAMTPQAGQMADAFKGMVVSGDRYGYTGECLRGRGSCEQKGALAAMMYAVGLVEKARRCAGVRFDGSLVFLCSTAGETGRHDAVDCALDNLPGKPGLAVVGLGTSNQVCLGNKGRIDVIIEVHGRASHSSAPHEGVNAIEGARLVLNALSGLAPRGAHESLGESTFAPMHIESFPRATHTIQDLCVIAYDRRLLPGETPEAALDEIRWTVSGIEGFGIEVKQGPLMYPSEVSRNSRVASLLSESFSAVTGLAPSFTYFKSSLDAGLLNLRGVETVMFGPGDTRFAHTSDEVVPVEQLEQAAKAYAHAALKVLCGDR